MGRIRNAEGRLLGRYRRCWINSPAAATRLALGLLRDRPELRGLFPGALRNSAYRHWLSERGPFGARGRKAALSFAAAFAGLRGSRVRDYYLHSPGHQRSFPLALVPGGQKRFVGWLLGKGRLQHDLSEEEILWFLHESAEDPEEAWRSTFLVQPEWQRLAETDEELPSDFLRVAERPGLTFREVGRSIGGEDAAAAAATAPGVNILGHFCYPCGLQQAGLALKSALTSAGLATSCRDVPAGVRMQLGTREAWLGLEKYPVTIINVAPWPHFKECYARSGLWRRHDVHRIAYWYWEFPTVPALWHELAPLVDEVWTPTPFVTEALRASLPLPVHEIAPAVVTAAPEPVARERFGLGAETFVFLFMFDMFSDFERKNPLALLRAYRRAFGPRDDVHLLIKVTRGGVDLANLARLRKMAAEEGAPVTVCDELVSREQATGYIAMSDAVVSLHRSEGFGLVLAEAMALGKPVIGTRYSGNLAFMNGGNSLLVEHRLVRVDGHTPRYPQGAWWAEPSETHAADCLRAVYEDRSASAQRAARAEWEIRQNFGVEAAGRRMVARLEAIGQGATGMPLRNRDEKAAGTPLALA